MNRLLALTREALEGNILNLVNERKDFAVDALTSIPKLVSKGSLVPAIEIYTKTFCSFCWRAKSLLQAKGVEFREISVDHGGSEKEEMVQRSNGRTTVPQIFIGDIHVGGCDDLMELDRDGRLDPLISEPMQ